MDPTYDKDAVNPFLGRLSETPGDFFHGEPLHPDALREEDEQYYYHATTLGNFRGILEDGLDPGRGGRGGAGENIAAPVDPEMGAEFIESSRGYVHFANNPRIPARYAYEYETQADGHTRYYTRSSAERADIRRSAVDLRFNRNILDERLIEPDPDESEGAYRTTERIAPENLEYLAHEGWVPLEDEAVRGEIYQNINQVLGSDRSGTRVPTSFEEIEREENPNRGYGTTPPERSIGQRSRGLDSF